jgi:hypothetical protein
LYKSWVDATEKTFDGRLMPPVLKTYEEIQKAHDILSTVILNKFDLSPFLVDQYDRVVAAIKANCDVLCWILQHEHNPTFRINYEAIVDLLEGMGLELVKDEKLQVAPKGDVNV